MARAETTSDVINRVNREWESAALASAKRWAAMFGGDAGSLVARWKELGVGLVDIESFILSERRRREFVTLVEGACGRGVQDGKE